MSARATARGATFMHGGVLLFALALAGCNREASKVSERFLQALAREDYDAAFVELHPDALPYTPDAATLRDRMEKGGIKLISWSGTCSSSGAMFRTGYNVTTQTRTAGKRPIIVGVAPQRSGKCNGPMLVELKQESASPNAPWKVRSLQF